MIAHFTPRFVRLVGLLLPLTPWFGATSFAAGATSNAAEWVTQDAPQVVELREGVQLTLAPNTRVVRQPSVPVPGHLKQLAPRAYAVELVKGRLDVNIETRHQPIYALMVRAPRHVAAFSKGGQSTVLALPQGVVLASLSGNELSGSSSDKWRSLRVGTALVVSREAPAGTVHDLLKQPVLQANNSLKLSLGASEPTNLSWSAVPEAQSYRVTLCRETADGSIPMQDFDVSQTTFELPPLQAGLYTATVSAVNHWHIGSPPSNRVPVRVIGVELPEGAYVYNGIPQLGRLQQVHLSQVKGLEMAYGSAALFSQAPDSLGLPTGHPLLVRFREPGVNSEVSLVLEPRSIRSSIQFEPKGATWPGQAVKVIVRIFGPDGTDLPESVDVSINSTVNARPIDVHWAHEGHTWQARIEQPPLAGPWILRVTVNDQVGQVLAHDFMEIALPPRRTEDGSSLRYSSRY